jgi:hypothetical protein
MRTSEFGFDKAGDDTGPRMETLLNVMLVSDTRAESFRVLARHKTAYLQDSKATLERIMRGRLEEAGIQPTPDLLDDLTMSAFDFIARAMAKFMLPVAEIAALGAIAGDLPHMESERMIDMGDLDDLD